ncbi:hypothetical protein [Neisseria sicca]|uniref:hypothetical protein n=1 Tax=Neisseria sicca TaxID=490 RepID=UPI0019590768|nr:hypothetical protein [Neisseria sicca]VTX79766.1 Uncharacterised protein [Neisseria sicca]
MLPCIADIPGFDDRSVWGYDEPTNELYIQLYKNDSDDEEPDFWIMQSIDNIELFFMSISNVTGISVSDVYLTLAEFIPDMYGSLSNIFANYIQEEINFFPEDTKTKYITRHDVKFYEKCANLSNVIISNKAREALMLLQSAHNLELSANYK